MERRFIVRFDREFDSDIDRIKRRDFFETLLDVLQRLRPEDELVLAAANPRDPSNRKYRRDTDGEPCKTWTVAMKLVVPARDHVFGGEDGSAEQQFLEHTLAQLRWRLDGNPAFLLPSKTWRQLKEDTDMRPADRFMLGVKAMHANLEARQELPSGEPWPELEDMPAYGHVTSEQLRAFAQDTIGHITSDVHARSVGMAIAVLSAMFLVRHYGQQPGGEGGVGRPLQLEESLDLDLMPEDVAGEDVLFDVEPAEEMDVPGPTAGLQNAEADAAAAAAHDGMEDVMDEAAAAAELWQPEAGHAPAAKGDFEG